MRILYFCVSLYYSGLKAIKLLANFLEDPSSKDTSISQIKDWLSDPIDSGNKTLQIIAATFFIYDDNIKEAFKVIRNGSSIEQ